MTLEEQWATGPIARAAIAELRGALRGEALVPGDARYDEARQPWNRHAQQRPALIVAAADVDDVITAVRFAAANELPVAIMRTGHGVVAPCDGGLLLLTERLQGVSVDPVARVARVSAGALWQDVLEESLAFGLTPLVGSTPYVGAVGYSLGGGLGWLARKYGLAVDSVRAFDIVTADGRLRRVMSASEPDLFWAVRGGGGNFGVVTALECDLYAVGEVYGGNLFYPIEAAAEVLRAYNDWAPTLPDEFTTSFLMIRFPPMPELPPALAGKAFAVARGCYAGPAAMGEELLRPMRAAAPVVIDAFAPMPVGALEQISSDPVDPMPVFSWTETLRDLGPATAQALIRLYADSPAVPFFAIEARHMGGSAAIRAPRENAFSLRGAEYALFVYGLAAMPQLASALPGYLASDAPPATAQGQRPPTPDGQGPAPEVERAIRSYLAEVASALKPHATGMLYYNFLSEADISPERARATHTPAHYQRLATLKAVFDPANMFRYNPNITPSGPTITH